MGFDTWLLFTSKLDKISFCILIQLLCKCKPCCLFLHVIRVTQPSQDRKVHTNRNLFYGSNWNRHFTKPSKTQTIFPWMNVSIFMFVSTFGQINNLQLQVLIMTFCIIIWSIFMIVFNVSINVIVQTQIN